MKIYHNPRCSKSRQTLQLLHENKVTPEIIEYLINPPSKAELKQVIKLLGVAPDTIIRKGEAIYKEKFKGKQLNDEEWLEAMIAYPKLIERPIVFTKEKAVIGRPPENVLEMIKNK